MTAWYDDLFTASTLNPVWTATTPNGSVTYPATGGTSVQLASLTSGNTIWTNDQNATRLHQPIDNDSNFNLYTAVIDNANEEAGIFVGGANLSQDFVKFGRFNGGFTFGRADGGSTDFSNGGDDGGVPVALRLERAGTTWNAYYATDQAGNADNPGGVSWTLFDTLTADIVVTHGGLYLGGVQTSRFDYAVADLPNLVPAVFTAALGGLAGTASAVRQSNAAAVAGFGGLTATASGGRQVNAAAASTWGTATATATGLRDVSAVAAGSLGGLGGGLAAARDVAGTGNATLGGLGGSTATTRAVTATIVAGLGGLTATMESDDSMTTPAPTSLVLCASWANVPDIPATTRAEHGLTDPEWQAYLLRASELLWSLSGRTWYGPGCTEEAVMRSQPPLPGQGTWPWHTTWGDCACWATWGGTLHPGVGPSFRHVDRPYAVRLPREHVTSIVSVTVDGDPFLQWRLTRQGWLERTDGLGWSVCDGDTVIRYTFGEPPPAGGVAAAVELAVELMLEATNNQLCRLPNRTTSVTRQGVTMELSDPLELFDRGRTGLSGVDRWLMSVNPYGRQASGGVWSPDLPATYRRSI